MKVLLFANTDWYLYNFRLPLAKAIRTCNTEVVMVSPHGRYGPLLRDHGFRWIPMDMTRRSLNPLNEVRLIKALVAVYRKERPDLVHHFTLKCVVYGSLAARAAGTKGCVNGVTGLGYVFSSGSVLARVLRPLLKLALRIVLRGRQMRLIVQNADDRAMLLGENLVLPQYLRLIRGSGVDTARFRPRESCRREGQRPLRVLLATRLLWDKGIAEFVEAARLLKAEGVPADFLLAGRPDPGNPASVPAEFIARSHKEGLITHLGHVEQMDKLLSEVDLVVLPTTYGEGVPRILLEAAASGHAIVATDVPGCREIVDHGVNGLLVTPKNAEALAKAIKHMAENAEAREQMGQAGRAKALAEFDERIVISETLAVYRELVPSLSATESGALS